MREKAPRYARTGVRELWIVNLQQDRLEVFREPGPDGYVTASVFRRGETIAPLAFPDLQIAVDDILGAPED